MLRLLVSCGVLAIASTAYVRADPPAQPAAPLPPALTVTVPTYPNTTCPIMAKPASRAMFADTTKGRIYVCCTPCIAKILKDPDRAYATAYPTTKKAGNTVCPVTDKPLGTDAVTIVLQGYEIGVCATCAEKARTHHQITLAKALDPKIVEIRNETCPVTREPVATNAFCVIGTDLVHLSSPKAVEEVKKDPAKALRTAKEIVAAQQAKSAPGGGSGR